MDYIDAYMTENAKNQQKIYAQAHEGKSNMEAIVTFEEKQHDILQKIDTTILTEREQKTAAENLKIPFKNVKDVTKAIVFDRPSLEAYVKSTYANDLGTKYVNTVLKGLFDENFAKRLLYGGPSNKIAWDSVLRMGRPCVKLAGKFSTFLHQLVNANRHCTDKRLENRKVRNFFERKNRNMRQEEIAKLIRLAIKEEPIAASEVAALLICDDLSQFKAGLSEPRPDLESEAACRNWLDRNGDRGWRNLSISKGRDNFDDLSFREVIMKFMNEKQTIAMFERNADKLDSNGNLEDMCLVAESLGD